MSNHTFQTFENNKAIVSVEDSLLSQWLEKLRQNERLNHLNTIFVSNLNSKKKNIFIVCFEMGPLATNQRVLTWLCICPFDQDASIWKKSFFIILTLFLFTFEVSSWVSSIIFFVTNVSVDLENCLYAVFQIAATSGLIYMWMVAFISRKRINQFLGTLANIYDESNS